MRKGITFLIVILLSSFSLLAQNSTKVHDITLPDSVVSRIIDDLIIKDRLVFEDSKKDEIIKLLNSDLLTEKEKAILLTGNIQDLQAATKRLKELVAIREAELKDSETALRKVKAKGIISHILTGVAVIALYIALK